MRADGNRALRGLYSVARPLVESAARLVHDIEITGRDRLPVRGAYILAPNHLSFIDPVLTSMAARRNVRFMAVGFLFNQARFFDQLMLFFGTIPTHRGVVPVGAIRAALSHLQGGGVVGVYPEGRRVATWGEEMPAQGAAWLSLATGAPVFPVSIRGTEGTLSITEKRYRASPVRMWIEEPLDPLDFTDSSDPAAAMMNAWHEALDRRLAPWWAKRTSDGDAASGTTGHMSISAES